MNEPNVCFTCGKWFIVDPRTYPVVNGCAALHEEGECCHVGYVEVVEPESVLHIRLWPRTTFGAPDPNAQPLLDRAAARRALGEELFDKMDGIE